MSEEGKLFDHAELSVVDDWSRAIFERIKDWEIARASGAWTTWAGSPHAASNYLLLELMLQQGGERSESVAIYTADEEVTFATRGWHAHLPSFERVVEDYVEAAASEAIELSQRWFSGEFLIVNYYLGDAWKSSSMFECDRDLRSELDIGLSFIRYRSEAADRVEVRGPFKSADRVFAIGASGICFDN